MSRFVVVESVEFLVRVGLSAGLDHATVGRLAAHLGSPTAIPINPDLL